MPTLDFKGKQFVYAHHLSVPFRQLDIDTKKSVASKGGKPGLDDNLIIHGDNLHALKALLPKYAGRVKCIYIDPPYNTGSEGWCYNDNVNAPLMKEWLKKEGNPVDKEDLERHDKWLCMMWPRLQLLRELLADDGVIFVSIGMEEQHHLISIMNEIFGEGCFKNIVTIRRGVKNVQAQFETIDSLNRGHEYVLFFSKSGSTRFDKFFVPYEKTDDEEEEELTGSWNNHWRGTDRPTMRYKIFGIKPETGQWRWGEERSRQAVRNWEKLVSELGNDPEQVAIDDWVTKNSVGNDKTDLLRLSSNGKPEHYVPLAQGKLASDLWSDLKPNGGSQLKKVMGKKVFDTPKSIDLIKRIIEFSCSDNDIVLDSFAGSGTTAHAVLELNKQDGGNRKFILVECEDYADTITAERVRRVIKGVPAAKDEALKNGLGGSFTFCELGKEINIDNLLKGGELPDYDELARYAFFTSTGQTLDKVKQGADYFVGETDQYRVHVIYKPDAAFLRSGDSALNAALAASISKARGKKTALVFATHKFMGQKELTEMGVTYCQLPYAIHRVMGD